MTYCIGLKLIDGLLLLSDTRTNAGVDNISRFGKTFRWQVPGDRAIALTTAGNLSITQGVVSRIDKRIELSQTGANVETILNAKSMFRVAQIFGETMQEVQNLHRDSLLAQGAGPDSTLLVAGQRNGGQPRLFMVYSAGNFIEATNDTPFFQLGEHKYGKPILDRVIETHTPIPVALKAALVSMDSTLRSNLSVGMPLDLTVIPTGMLNFSISRRIEADDAQFQMMSAQWSDALRAAFHALPEMQLEAPRS